MLLTILLARILHFNRESAKRRFHRLMTNGRRRLNKIKASQIISSSSYNKENIIRSIDPNQQKIVNLKTAFVQQALERYSEN